MDSNFSAFDAPHQLGDNATHPIAPPWRTLAALLLLAGTSLLRRRALPAHAMTAHSGAFNRGF